MKSIYRRIRFTLFALLATVGCGDGGTGPISYDGMWSGTTSQGRPISFTVAGNAVTVATIGYSASGNCSPVPTGSTITPGVPLPINGTSISITFGGGTITGTFSSATAASGTFSVSFAGIPSGCSSNASGTWTATR